MNSNDTVELIGKEDCRNETSRPCDENEIQEMMLRIQRLENTNRLLPGISLVVMGLALSALSATVGGNNVLNFISGVMTGLAVGGTLVGVCIITKALFKLAKD